MINEILFPIVLFIVVFSFECCLLYKEHNSEVTCTGEKATEGSSRTVNQLQTAFAAVSPTAETKVRAQSIAPLQHAPQLEVDIPEMVNSPVTPKPPQLDRGKIKELPQTVQQLNCQPWKPNLDTVEVETEPKKTTRRRPKTTKSTTAKTSTRKKKAIAQGAVLEDFAQTYNLGSACFVVKGAAQSCPSTKKIAQLQVGIGILDSQIPSTHQGDSKVTNLLSSSTSTKV